ncbi:FUSC family protein [Acuticoccus sp. M5D2P5]|uniref:FUSC family protein n=1 Tax=Acuticoccus kalidii TaxID=2910977 RepID=UPI001F3BA758|nr:FUSC family protein [Acuticoccus kalidii]MCF3932819.1 FUSC family protein [Acuticoccus kalidii]
MTPIAEATWPRIYAQTVKDLASFPGRFGFAWRVAAMCAIVTCLAMLYEIPEAAISCYLVIFLMRPDSSETLGQAVGLIVLVTVIVAVMVPLINSTIDSVVVRILIMAGASFVALFFASASTLGETAAIIGLVIAFVLSLVSAVPAGIVATIGLKLAWEMVAMPMAVMIGFLLIFGRGPQSIVAETIARRIEAARRAFADPDDDDAVFECLDEGNAASLKRVMVARLLHLVPSKRTRWLGGASEASYRLLLAAAALPRSAAAERDRLAATCGAHHEAVVAGRVPPSPEHVLAPTSPAEAEAWRALESLAAPDGGGPPKSAKEPLLAADAFTNPVHQRYALKATAAAMICYLIYTGVSWQGIHTAMITCYVTALGTTGETVHKLVLRILGCLFGAALGVASIMFIIPHLGSVGGLMILVFVAILIAGWIAAGDERIAYSGVQVGLAFLLTILDGFGPSTDMSNAGDRIAGILLGNTIMYVIFTRVWPRSAIVEVREKAGEILSGLSRLAAMDPAAREAATPDIARIAMALGRARDALFTLPFEPARLQPARAEVERLTGLLNAASGLLPSIALSRERLDGVAAELGEAATAVRAEEARPDGIAEAERADAPIAAGIEAPMARIRALFAT